MKTKVLMSGVFVIYLVFLNGCANSNRPDIDEVNYRPGYVNNTINYQPANYDVGYGPGANEIDFNHDAAVGYGGVNVYDYNTML